MTARNKSCIQVILYPSLCLRYLQLVQDSVFLILRMSFQIIIEFLQSPKLLLMSHAYYQHVNMIIIIIPWGLQKYLMSDKSFYDARLIIISEMINV